MGKATRVRTVDPGRVDPTPEQLAQSVFDYHQVHDPDTGGPINVRRNLTTRNLERWHNRGLISVQHYLAGEKYRSDYERAGFNQRVTSCYDIVTAGGQAGHYRAPGGQNEAQMDAWKRWREAREAVPFMLRGGFDWLAVFDEIGLEIVARDAQGIWTPRTCIPMVTVCLAQLAKFYKVPNDIEAKTTANRPNR